MFKPLLPIVAAVCAATLPGQLSGSYTLDPGGAGPRNFPDLTAAAYALSYHGISGPVVIDVVAGVHTGDTIMLPIPGASASNSVTIRAQTSGAIFRARGKTVLHVQSAGNPVVRVRHLILSGLEFEASATGGQSAVGMDADDVSVVDCIFRGVSYDGRGDRHEVSGCELVDSERGITAKGEGCRVHHNLVRASASQSDNFGTFWGAHGVGQRSRVYNNLFHGAFSGSSTRLTIKGAVDFIHNTVVERPGPKPHTHALAYVAPSLYTHPTLSNNILVNENAGFFLMLDNTTGVQVSPYSLRCENNLFFAPQSVDLFKTYSPSRSYRSIGSWQAAFGLEAGSFVADPQFVDIAKAPAGLALQIVSPAVSAARGTPAYVADDFSRRKRRVPSSIGGLETGSTSTFTPVGFGCAGTQGHIPAIGYSGFLGMGSPNFAVTVSKANGSFGGLAYLAIGAPTSVNLGGSCVLLVNPVLVLPTVLSGTGPGQGSASIKLPLPAGSQYRGLGAFLQWGVPDKSAAGIGLALSRAAYLIL